MKQNKEPCSLVGQTERQGAGGGGLGSVKGETLRPEPKSLDHLPQEMFHDSPAFQSTHLGVPEAGMRGPSLHTSWYCYLSLQALLALSPSHCQRAAHTPQKLRPSHRLWIFSSRFSAQKALTS